MIAILNTAGTAVVEYTYDAWGNMLPTTGTMASTLGEVNPLTYRGYVYDHESGLYYLQSRYYDPVLGRFINADAFTSTGQGLLGNNMFAYCGNNPVSFFDSTGHCACTVSGRMDNKFKFAAMCPCGGGVTQKTNHEQQEELAVLNAKGISLYNNVPVIRVPFGGNAAFSAGVIFLGDRVEANESGIATLKHEYGHVIHLSQIGWESYTIWVLIPSVVNYHRGVAYDEYYSQPWEYIADFLGGVDRMNGSQRYVYTSDAQTRANEYYQFTYDYVGVYPNQ